MTPSQQAQSAAPSTSGVDAIALLQNAGGWGNQATLDLVGAAGADSMTGPTGLGGSPRLEAFWDGASARRLVSAFEFASSELRLSLQQRARVLRMRPTMVGTMAEGFGEAASRAIRTLLPAASAAIAGSAGSALASVLAPQVGSEVEARMTAYAGAQRDTQVLADEALEAFFLQHVEAWNHGFYLACMDLTTSEAIEAFVAVVEHLVRQAKDELVATFQVAILEPFLQLGASLPAGRNAFGEPSGVYNFTLQYADGVDGVHPTTLGMPSALGAREADLLRHAPGLWRSQVFELVSADGSLTALVSAGRAELVHVEPVAREALQVRGFGDAEVVRELRHRASRGDPDASGALGEYEQRGVQAIWDDLLSSVGDAAFAEVDSLRILTHA